MFKEIHDYYEKVKTEVEDAGRAGLEALVTEVRAGMTDAKAEALKEVAVLAPDIQAAVQKALAELEQAVLAAIASHIV